MIGNDVVDLQDGDARPGSRHPRFDRRVFAANELAALASSAAPDRLRWVFWAAKEAAYKVARKQDPQCVFSPVRFLVTLSGVSRGVVEFGQARYPVRVEGSNDAVHVVATHACVPAKRIVLGMRKLSPEALRDASAPSRAVRELAVSRVGGFWNDGGVVTVVQDGRVPMLERDGVRVAADLSLSHHGRWVAFACELAGSILSPAREPERVARVSV